MYGQSREAEFVLPSLTFEVKESFHFLSVQVCVRVCVFEMQEM